MKRYRLTLVVVLIIISILFVDQFILGGYVVEGQEFRAFEWDYRTLWRFKPSYHGPAYGQIIQINSAGFRGPEPKPYKPSLRIVAIGDSRTFGYAVNDRQTFSAQIEQELIERGIDAEVLNAGTLGYSIVQCRGKLEQMLSYEPDIVLLTAGYNDRRYLLLTPPDSAAKFRSIVTLKKFSQIVEWSHLMGWITQRLQRSKLTELKSHPPALDRAAIRVPPETFRAELEQIAELCERQNIQLVFVPIPQNPSVFGQVEAGYRYYLEGRYQAAIDWLEKLNPDLHIAAHAYCHFVLGLSYEKSGNSERSKEYFNRHEPLGSLHGEAILHCEQEYDEIFQTISQDKQIPCVWAGDAIRQVNRYIEEPELDRYLDEAEELEIPLLDGTAYIPRVDNKVIDLENFYRGRYVDECHLDAAGHFLIAQALAETIEKLERAATP